MILQPSRRLPATDVTTIACARAPGPNLTSATECAANKHTVYDSFPYYSFRPKLVARPMRSRRLGNRHFRGEDGESVSPLAEYLSATGVRCRTRCFAELLSPPPERLVATYLANVLTGDEQPAPRHS